MDGEAAGVRVAPVSTALPSLRSFVEAGGARLVLLASRVVLPPLILAHLGVADMGLWSLCFVLLGVIGSQPQGLTPFVVGHAARLFHDGDVAGLSDFLSRGMAVLALAFFALMGLALLGINGLVDLLHVGAAQRTTAGWLFLLAIGAFIFDGTLGALMSLLPAVGRERSQTQIFVLAATGETLVVIALLLAGGGLFSLAAAFIVRQAALMVASWVLLHRAVPGLSLRPHWPRRADLAHWAPALSLQPLISLGDLLGQTADRWLAGLLLGPAAVTLFDLGGKFGVSALAVPAAMSALLLPACSAAMGRGDDRALAGAVDQGAQRVAIASALIFPLLGVIAAPLCVVWLGAAPERMAIAALLLPLAIACHAQSLFMPLLALERSTGRPDAGFAYVATRLALVVVAGFAAQQLAPGDALALAWGVALASVAATALRVAGALRWAPQARAGWLRRTLLPTVAGYATAGFALAVVPAAAASAGRLGQLPTLIGITVVHAAGLAALCLLRRDCPLRELLARRPWRRRIELAVTAPPA
jgi:O-antigen/teichoic acid export membrane protein